jgi:DNA-binding HxlR family transcriptional regulator
MAVENENRRQVGRVFVRGESRQEAFEAMSDLLGHKWHLPVLYHLLLEDGMGFSGLRDRIDGISAKMLSESLETLESRYGIVEREIVEDQPLRVEYSLTEVGRSLERPIVELTVWARDNGDTLGWSEGDE